MAKPKGSKARTDTAKYEAVNLYKQVGSLNLVSTMLGIPYDTIRKWHIQDWWKDYELDIVQSTRAKSNTKIKRIAEKALLVVEDRLENGDAQLNMRTGEVIRIPLKAVVANRILHDSLDREALNDQANENSKKTLSDEKMSDRLLKIQIAFRELKQGGKRKMAIDDFTDVEIVEDALHEEREAGLQEGGPVGCEPLGPQRLIEDTSQSGQTHSSGSGHEEGPSKEGGQSSG